MITREISIFELILGIECEEDISSLRTLQEIHFVDDFINYGVSGFYKLTQVHQEGIT